MSDAQDRPRSDDFGAEYWEDRYQAVGPRIPHDPSPSLVAETAGLPPGRALDAGCGPGADALWLAARGWHVTAVDVSATAIARARDRAQAAGDEVAARIEWIHADLTTWNTGDRRFNLVTSHYVHAPGPAEDLFGRLASWVAPGGTLLVVGHASGPGTGPDDHNHGRGDDGDHAHPPGIRPEQVTAGLPQDQGTFLSRTSGATQSGDPAVQAPSPSTTPSSAHNGSARRCRDRSRHGRVVHVARAAAT